MQHSFIIKCEGISKSYKLYNSNKMRLLELMFKRRVVPEKIALNNINFQVERGDSFALLGLNGSGKSTLAQIIAGLSVPTSGNLVINGTSGIMSVNVGLNPELTGLENIEYKSILMGYKSEKRRESLPEIVEFADIGEYISQPVKTYSSGMKARLGFAISVNARPDVLIIDEGLSVGDQSFTYKCLAKMNEMRSSGMTIIFVSHNLSTVEGFCTKGIWLEYGRLKQYGDIKTITGAYSEFIGKYSKMSTEEKKRYRSDASI